METTKERLQHFVKELGYGRNKFEETVGIASGYLSSKSVTVASDVIEKILCYFPELDANWLFTGKGEMYKHNEAGRDNVGTGNEIAGDNKGVIGNTGTVGNVGCHNINVPDNAKKIIEGDRIEIEMDSSTQILLLEQRNQALEQRVKDLEALTGTQADMIDMYKSIIGKK